MDRRQFGQCLAALAQLPIRRDEPEPAAGRMLVAGRELADPNFAHAAVILVSYSRTGAMGLVLNRRSRGGVVSRVVRDLGSAANASDPLYAGGPVGRDGILALLKSSKKPGDTTPVTADVHLISDGALLEKQLRTGLRGDSLRLYLGYAGWAPGQLEREIETGAWHVFNADAATVFDAEPESLWRRLIRRTELRYA